MNAPPLTIDRLEQEEAAAHAFERESRYPIATSLARWAGDSFRKARRLLEEGAVDLAPRVCQLGVDQLAQARHAEENGVEDWAALPLRRSAA
jgi:hypothetical protein